MKKHHVLIIEDDSQLLELIRIVVNSLGHTATGYDNVELALTDFSEATYKLVITDLFMEEMCGIAGIQWMKRMDPEVSILAISAGYEKMSKEDALRAATFIGADDVLAKPFVIEDLTELLKKYLPDE